MISYLVNKGSPLFWLSFHVALGVICTITPWVLIGWFYIVFLSSLFLYVSKNQIPVIYLIFLIAYSTSFELLARMSGTSPYIPYELGKYILFALLIVGILRGYRSGHIGWIMLVLLLPALLIDEAGTATLKNIIFNLVGPINVVLAVIFFRQLNLGEKDLFSLVRLLIYPLVSVLAYTIIKTPDLDNVEYTLNANFAASGGFGTNQVSTALGLGAFLVFLFFRYKYKLTGYRWLDLILLFAFVFRGLMTFSRGGMIGGALGIITVFLLSLIYYPQNHVYNKAKTIFFVLIISTMLTATFFYANRMTGGLLLLRYQGETPGTLRGTREKTLNTITANRLKIFLDDIALWRQFPFLGTGVGASSYLRESSRGYNSHTEISRLLAEHGIFGLVYVILLFRLGIYIFRNQCRIPIGAVFIAFYVIALFTTFHAATRTYISPLLFGLSLLTINSDPGGDVTIDND